jgi:membrane protease YdiL (CAAX protease family)
MARPLLRVLLRPAAETPPREDKSAQIAREVQARYLVGADQIMRQLGSGGSGGLYPQAKLTLNTGPVQDRLVFIVLAGELSGPDEALDQIRRLRELMADEKVTPTADEAAVLDALTRLYMASSGKHVEPPVLSEKDRDLLRNELGWCGELALAPKDGEDTAARDALLKTARRTAAAVLGIFAVAVLLGFLGLVALIVLGVFFLLGAFREAMPPPTAHAGVYAEAFAVYMVVFLVLSLLARFVLPADGPELLVSGAGMLLSLAAGLAWPVLRGIPWRQVREEVGLTLGRKPVLEPVIGLGGYALAIPTFGIGIIVTLVLFQLQRSWQVGDHPEKYFDPVEQPSHPIVEWVAGSNLWLVVQIAILACVLAPLVEETMFRGVLYCQLRVATARWGRLLSFLASALIVSVLFAAVHPQGIVFIPALAGLAFGLNILREWRGTLLPSMMVHGIHNGLVTFLLVQSLRG